MPSAALGARALGCAGSPCPRLRSVTGTGILELPISALERNRDPALSLCPRLRPVTGPKLSNCHFRRSSGAETPLCHCALGYARSPEPGF